MALYRCGGGGGELEETVLWTNPSQSTNFSAQTLTLSDDIDNYDFIKLTWKSSTTVSIEADVYWEVSDVKNFSEVNDEPQGAICSKAPSGSYRYARRIYYVSDTQLGISGCSVIGAASSNEALVIPVKVSGMKYGNKRPSAAPIAIGTFTASTSAQTTVSLGFKPKYLCIRQYSSASAPYVVYICDERYSTTGYQGAGTGAYLANQAYEQTNNNRIYKLTDDGFIFNKVASGTTNCDYFAIG